MKIMSTSCRHVIMSVLKNFDWKRGDLSQYFKFCRRVCLSCLKFWQWRRKYLEVSVPFPQSQIEFSESRKLWQRLCFHIWLKPTHILARQFKATELQTLKVLLREGLINYEICFLNIGYEGGSQMFGFN